MIVLFLACELQNSPTFILYIDVDNLSALECLLVVVVRLVVRVKEELEAEIDERVVVTWLAATFLLARLEEELEKGLDA